MSAPTCPGCGGEGMFHRHPCPLLAEGLRRAASGMEARRAAAENTDAVHDSPTAATSGGDAQPCAWRIRFEAPAGARILSRGCGITVMGGRSMWWNMETRRWMDAEEVPWGRDNPERTYGLSSHAPCRTFKAFKRHLRKHADELTGCEVVFASRFRDNDVWAVPEAIAMETGTAIDSEAGVVAKP